MCIYVWYFFKNKTNLQIAPVNYNNNNNLFSRKKNFFKSSCCFHEKNVFKKSEKDTDSDPEQY